MPTPGAGINSVGVSYELIATDKERQFRTTIFNGFGITFELNAADLRYYETTIINGFGVGFEYSPLNVEPITLRRF